MAAVTRAAPELVRFPVFGCSLKDPDAEVLAREAAWNNW
jgi:hypothetical protein